MTDGTRRSWTITVRAGRAAVRQGAAPDPALRVRVPLADFVRVITDAEDSYPMIVDGRMTMDGDLALANRLSEMFGGRSVF